jgi:hypothetical protein
MLLGLMLFGVPSMMVASKKGFADSRWLLTFGIIGLIIVCCLPSAKARGISHEISRARRERANTIGAVLCGINVAVGGLVMFVYMFVGTFR